MLLHFIPDLITALWHCYIVRSSNGEQSPFKPKHKKLLKSEQWGKKIYGCYMDVCLMIPVRHEKNEISKEAEIDFLREWKAVSCWKLELCFLFPFFFFSFSKLGKKIRVQGYCLGSHVFLLLCAHHQPLPWAHLMHSCVTAKCEPLQWVIFFRIEVWHSAVVLYVWL